MPAVENTLGPVFLLIILGILLGWRDLPGGDFWPRAERLIYMLLFPALLIHALATADFAQVPVVRLAITALGSLLAFAALLWMARDRLGLHDYPAFTSVFQGALRFNTYVAIAGAGALNGSAGTTTAAVVIALLVPTVNVLSVLCLVAGKAGSGRASRSVREVVRNPLIMACALGVLLNVTGIGLPGWSRSLLHLIGQAALPLALLAVGVALRPTSLFGLGRGFWIATTIKLLLLPAATVLLAWLCALDAVSRDVVLLFAATSTATSSYILARQLRGDSDLMATLITGQTLLAMITLPAWLLLFR